MMVVQIIMNNSLTHYGAASVYGDAIPLACAGIVIKVNQIFFSIVIGLSQGSQPVESFNYGAKNYDRVRKAFSLQELSFLLFLLYCFRFFQDRFSDYLERENQNILNLEYVSFESSYSLSG